MTAAVYDLHGKKAGEVKVPKVFKTKVREDVVAKYVEVDKFAQPYAPNDKAGKQHSASGTISHKRHDWKGHYGRGISRIPRKTMWRRGTQFHWIGAEISSTRGGRRAHPPKGIGKEKKLNKKEIKLAMNSAFAATTHKDYIVKRYATLSEFDVKTPVVVTSKVEGAKTKDIIGMLKKAFGKATEKLVVPEKTVRAGKGKLRNRKYKKNAGVLLVTGNDELVKANGITVRNLGEVTVGDLYPLGRLTAYTEKAIEELSK